MKARRKILACVVSASLLAGCSVLAGRRETISVYDLTLTQSVRVEGAVAVSPWQLVVFEPEALAPLDGSRILVMPAPGQMQVYRGARWRDATPAMLQQLMLRALQDSGRPIVAGPSSGIRSDFVLRSSLQDFQVELRGSLVVVIMRLNAQLIRSADGSVVAARRFETEERCAGIRMQEVSAGFERATTKVLAELVEWVVAAGDGATGRENRLMGH